MRRYGCSKFFSLSLSLIYFGVNGPLAYSFETNIWESRRSACYGQIRTVSLPREINMGQVVLLIEDIHRNSEAQESISSLLLELIRQKKVSLIAMEGAFEPVDMAFYRRFPYVDTIRTVANYLLREKEISGAFHAALISPTDVPTIGVDDERHYLKNVKAYTGSSSRIREYQDQLRQFRQTLSQQKASVFNPALVAFDAAIQAYDDGAISLTDHIRFLRRQTKDSFPMVDTFLEAAELEDSLDFSAVQRQREGLISELVRKMDQDEIQHFSNHAAAYRLGNVQHGDYYNYLKAVYKQKKLPSADFPALNSYIQYLLLSERINPELLFDEIEKLETAVYTELAITPQEQELVKETEYLFLAKKLINFSLTNQEWKRYKNAKQEIAAPLFYGNSLAAVGLPGTINAAMDMSTFEQFYIESEKRDELMAGNLLSALAHKKDGMATLVVGGFHSQGIRQKLIGQGITVVTFTPKFTNVEKDTGTSYLSFFNQQSMDFEKLFGGGKLFLSPSPIGSATKFGLLRLGVGEFQHPGLLKGVRSQNGISMGVQLRGDQDLALHVNSENPFSVSLHFDSPSVLQEASFDIKPRQSLIKNLASGFRRYGLSILAVLTIFSTHGSGHSFLDATVFIGMALVFIGGAIFTGGTTSPASGGPKDPELTLKQVLRESNYSKAKEMFEMVRATNPRTAWQTILDVYEESTKAITENGELKNAVAGESEGKPIVITGEKQLTPALDLMEKLVDIMDITDSVRLSEVVNQIRLGMPLTLGLARLLVQFNANQGRLQGIETPLRRLGKLDPVASMLGQLPLIPEISQSLLYLLQGERQTADKARSIMDKTHSFPNLFNECEHVLLHWKRHLIPEPGSISLVERAFLNIGRMLQNGIKIPGVPVMDNEFFYKASPAQIHSLIKTLAIQEEHRKHDRFSDSDNKFAHNMMQSLLHIYSNHFLRKDQGQPTPDDLFQDVQNLVSKVARNSELVPLGQHAVSFMTYLTELEEREGLLGFHDVKNQTEMARLTDEIRTNDPRLSWYHEYHGSDYPILMSEVNGVWKLDFVDGMDAWHKVVMRWVNKTTTDDADRQALGVALKQELDELAKRFPEPRFAPFKLVKNPYLGHSYGPSHFCFAGRLNTGRVLFVRIDVGSVNEIHWGGGENPFHTKKKIGNWTVQSYVFQQQEQPQEPTGTDQVIKQVTSGIESFVERELVLHQRDYQQEAEDAEARRLIERIARQDLAPKKGSKGSGFGGTFSWFLGAAVGLLSSLGSLQGSEALPVASSILNPPAHSASLMPITKAGFQHTIDSISITIPQKQDVHILVKEIREKKETVLLVDESLMERMDSHMLEALLCPKAENGQSFLIFAKTDRIKDQIKNKLAGLDGMAGRYIVMTSPVIFEESPQSETKNILLDELVELLATIRKTEPSNALTDVCLIAPPGYNLKIKNKKYLDIARWLITHDQLYIVGLSHSLQTALKAMIAA